MSGDWPPERDGPDEEIPSGAQQQDTAAEARLAEVTAYLASLPAPVLPDAVAERISAALAAEAAARGRHDGVPQAEAPSGDGTPSAVDGFRPFGATPAPAPLRRHRGRTGGHHGSRSRPVMAVTSVMAGLAVIAGIGYGISRSGPTYSGSVSSAAGSAPKDTFAAAPEASSAASSAAAGAGAAKASPQFTVSASGTKYQAATLAAQVRARLPRSAANSTGVPAAGPNEPVASAPTAALRGCVLQLTGGHAPQLVDRATYQGQPAYVIASSSHVWVVGSGCTAANAELITSVPLAPLLGNLRALVSVEQ